MMQTDYVPDREFSPDWSEGGVGWTDLHWAAPLDLPDVRLTEEETFFELSLVRRIEASGRMKPDIFRMSYGETPLMISARANAPDAAAMLVECGANIHARDRLGASPLH